MRVRDRYARSSIPLICRILGHKITGYGDGTPYLRPTRNWATTDGVGVLHVPLYGRCDHCGSDVLVGMIHAHNEPDGFSVKTKG